jgi:hypothetical protein
MPQSLRHDQVPAFVKDALSRLAPLLERLEAGTPPLPPGVWPPPPYPTTPTAIRRTIARLRAGKVHAEDPSLDGAAAADLLEQAMAYEELPDAVDREIDEIFRTITALVDTRAVRATADALMEFYNARQLDRDPYGELGELILEMHGALRIVEHRRK